ncbi:zinc ribbon domain-containing protein [Spiribacter roseus]|uniref:zinc ribbon domain-containing protein n=1 Tax=Spiribacter roseus TaxID=1855875 RepID=UPI0038B38B18
MVVAVCEIAVGDQCSGCGHVRAAGPLSTRRWQCSECGTEHDRDINAAVMRPLHTPDTHGVHTRIGHTLDVVRRCIGIVCSGRKPVMTMSMSLIDTKRHSIQSR